jgi:hypothetical protein
MSNEITEAAQKIADGVNAWYGSGSNGQLVFGRDGSGGAWYSEGTYGFGPNVVVFACGGLVKVTPDEVQEILDDIAE